MALVLAVPKEYGYVVAVTSATFFVNLWHGFRCSAYRRGTGIKYPKAFADSADLAAADADKQKAMYLFNCAQRAHGNYLESLTTVALSLLIAGVQYPTLSAGAGAGWLVGRIIYAIGYTSPSKNAGQGRALGYMLAAPFQLTLMGLAGYSGYKLLQ